MAAAQDDPRGFSPVVLVRTWLRRGIADIGVPKRPGVMILARLLLVLVWALGGVISTVVAFAGGGIFTTDNTGTVVNQNLYAASTDVFLSGGPQNLSAAGLADGTYYFQVTDPSGNQLLSTDNAVCRQLKVASGRVVGATGPCPHANGTSNPANGATPVQLAPFSATPNGGQEYKAWLIAQASSTSISSLDPRIIAFKQSDSSTDNFKAQQVVTVPTGSCQPSSSLSVLVSGTNVQAYVPKGNWSVTPVTGISVVNVEGSAITPTRISTPNVVNSVISNPLTGQSVAVANNTDVYLINGTTLTNTLTSGGSGFIQFSGGRCTNCGVALDALRNRALIGLSIGGAPGFQILNLGSSPQFEPAFKSPSGAISEDPLLDPIRNLLLSASERNNYEIINLGTSTSPAFFENPIAGIVGELDSSAEDCSTGIALAPAEFSSLSQVYIADLTQATFTPGSPGTWTAPSQVQTLSESVLSEGASGIAVAQGTNTGVVTGEFGGNALTAIALPTTSGSGTPAIKDWLSCRISGFSNGFDPHTVTAYRSPNTGDAIAVLANGGASSLAVVDLTKMLNSTIVPRTATGHGCAAGTLPSSVVTMISVP
jgi:hypothetical protein